LLHFAERRWQPGRFDARTFSYEGQDLTEVTLRVHARAQPGVGPDDLARVQRDAYAGVDRYYNSGQQLPNGNRLHVNVEFTDDPALAHLDVNIHPGGKGPLDRANQKNWYVDSEPTTHAHELGHQMGLLDEYHDPGAVNRAHPTSPGVHDDDSLMGNYWTFDANGNPVPKPATGLKPRHTQQIQDDIDNATQAHAQSPGGSTPAPAPPTRVPNAHQAEVDPRKLTDYALNPEHPVGGNKAKVFESATGFNKSNYEDLLEQLKTGVQNTDATVGKVDQYGQRFTVDIEVTGPKGTATVRTGWIVKPDNPNPTMTTLFVK